MGMVRYPRNSYLLVPECRNRQTMATQNRLGSRPWGFESLLRHHPFQPVSQLKKRGKIPPHLRRQAAIVPFQNYVAQEPREQRPGGV
jgi:hypothetical protein